MNDEEIENNTYEFEKYENQILEETSNEIKEIKTEFTIITDSKALYEDSSFVTEIISSIILSTEELNIQTDSSSLQNDKPEDLDI